MFYRPINDTIPRHDIDTTRHYHNTEYSIRAVGNDANIITSSSFHYGYDVSIAYRRPQARSRKRQHYFQSGVYTCMATYTARQVQQHFFRRAMITVTLLVIDADT